MTNHTFLTMFSELGPSEACRTLSFRVISTSTRCILLMRYPRVSLTKKIENVNAEDKAESGSRTKRVLQVSAYMCLIVRSRVAETATISTEWHQLLAQQGRRKQEERRPKSWRPEHRQSRKVQRKNQPRHPRNTLRRVNAMEILSRPSTRSALPYGQKVPVSVN